jgi:putative membrane protein
VPNSYEQQSFTPFMTRIIFKWLASAGAIYAAAYVVPGISFQGFGTALIVALVLGLINAVLKPLLVLISFPFIILSLGLLLLVINAAMLKLAAGLLDGFAIDGWIPAILGSIVITLVSMVANAVLDESKDKN